MKLSAAIELLQCLPPRSRARLGPAGLDQIAEILAGRWVWTRVDQLPGGAAVTDRLIHLGWVETFGDHAGNTYATLSYDASRWIGVEVDESPGVSWSTRYYERSDDDPEGGSVSLDMLQEFDRWETVGTINAKENYYMPRTRGISDLPFPDRVPAPVALPEPEPEPEPVRPVPIKILGVFTTPLRRKRRSSKPPKGSTRRQSVA